MGNVSGNAYALTVLSPIKNGHIGEVAYADEVRCRLQSWGINEMSPMSRVPQTYVSRYFVLDDVYTESLPGADLFGTLTDILSIFSNKIRKAALPYEDHLKSKYLVFSSDFHGDRDTYLRGMWNAIGDEIRNIWGFCYGFEQVRDANGFVAYIRKCQLTVTLPFVGSTDDSLEEQLKSLYLKQEFSKFAMEHQGMPAPELQKAYQEFIRRVQPKNLTGPTWVPGKSQ